MMKFDIIDSSVDAIDDNVPILPNTPKTVFPLGNDKSGGNLNGYTHWSLPLRTCFENHLWR
jgi:hypothetical protein